MKFAKQQLARAIFSNLLSKEPAYLLSDFVTFAGHVFARKLFDSFLSKDKQTSQLGLFNPVYLWGANDSGKTHIMVGIAGELRKAEHKILYATCENLTGSIIQAIRSECLYEFQQELRSCSILMIDEVSALSDKWRIQEEFFHAFNTLRTGGQQIILSSQTPPHKLSGIDDRLISRFEWGLLVPIQGPTQEEYDSFLQSLFTDNFLKVEKDVFSPIKKHFGNNLSAFASWLLSLKLTNHAEITKKMMDDALEQSPFEVRHNAISVEMVFSAITKCFQTTKEELLGKSQRKKLVASRRMAMYFLRTKLRLSLARIGRMFSRDDTTVSVSCKILEKQRKENPTINEQILAIDHMIEQQVGNSSE